MNRIGLIFAVLLLTAGGLQAQLITGEIRGVVNDPRGKSMPNVVVRLVNEATAEARLAASNEAGIFVFGAVAPGTYTIIAESPGFRSFERRGQAVAVGQKLSIAIDLAIWPFGQVTEKVTVSAEGAMVETESSNLQNSITERQFDRIQSQARDATSLLRIRMLPSEGSGPLDHRYSRRAEPISALCGGS